MLQDFKLQWQVHQRVLARLKAQAYEEKERQYVEEARLYLAHYCQTHPIQSNIVFTGTIGGNNLGRPPTASIARPSSSPLPPQPPPQPIITSVTTDKRRLATPLGMLLNSGQPTELIPIRLDIDSDGYKLRDSFLWNLNESPLMMETMAAITCRDFDLPPTLFIPLIIKSIQEQVEEYREAAHLLHPHTPMTSTLELGAGMADLKGIRMMIRLDVTVGFLQLTDQLEWDLGAYGGEEGEGAEGEEGEREQEREREKKGKGERENSRDGNDNTNKDNTTITHQYPPNGQPSLRSKINPITFAQHYCRELGLSGEWVTAIANDILDQVLKFRRALLIVGFTRDSRTGAIRIPDPDLQSIILPPLKSTRREPNSLNAFSPVLTEYDPLEMERLEQSRDREARRKRRQTRGRRGEAAKLTTVEAPKTMRTPLSYRGSLHRVASRSGGGGDDEENDGMMGGSGASGSGGGGGGSGSGAGGSTTSGRTRGARRGRGRS